MHWIFSAMIAAAIIALRFFGVPYRLALVGLAIGVVGLALSGLWQIKQSPAFLLALIPLAVSMVFVIKGVRVPPVADVTTRLAPVMEFPPQTAEASENAMEMSESARQAHHGAYQDLRTLNLSQDPSEQIKQFAESQGWIPVMGSPERMQFEVHSTLLGFVDDVVIEIRADGAGWQVDARSRSRVGVSDLGANAARLRALWDQLSSLTKT